MTQGRRVTPPEVNIALLDQWVTKYKVSYSVDELTFSPAFSSNGEQVRYDFIRFGLNVVLTYQKGSYRDSETNENVEAQKREQTGETTGRGQ